MYGGESRSLRQKHIPETLKSKLNLDQQVAEPKDHRAPELSLARHILMLDSTAKMTTCLSGPKILEEVSMAWIPKTRLLDRTHHLGRVQMTGTSCRSNSLHQHHLRVPTTVRLPPRTLSGKPGDRQTVKTPEPPLHQPSNPLPLTPLTDPSRSHSGRYLPLRWTTQKKHTPAGQRGDEVRKYPLPELTRMRVRDPDLKLLTIQSLA